MAVGLTRRAHEPIAARPGKGIVQTHRAKNHNRQSDPVRTDLPFRAVNRYGSGSYNSGLQRHHLLPLQLLSMRSFSRFFESMGLDRIGFDDFRRNGLLLPCCDSTATTLGLPMHRGPHQRYNALAIERVSQIELGWQIGGKSEEAGRDAVFRLGLLQAALRRRLLDPFRGPIPLNRHDPALRKPDFADIDAMADLLWAATELA
ncbi:MAG: AHH domain-containing protein [Novosphingobium sp.]